MNTKKFLFSSVFASILFVSGCATTDNAGDDDLEQMLHYGETPNGHEVPNVDQQDDVTSRLGYVRYEKDQLNTEAERNRYVAIDRNKMADTLTRMILRYDGFQDVATLVTDEEVLVAYQKPDDLERDTAADIVKKTALSLMPRFYDVYVSDQDSAFKNIESLQNSSTRGQDYGNTLDSIIEEMKQTPQGEPTEEEQNMEEDQTQ